MFYNSTVTSRNTVKYIEMYLHTNTLESSSNLFYIFFLFRILKKRKSYIKTWFIGIISVLLIQKQTVVGSIVIANYITDN